MKPELRNVLLGLAMVIIVLAILAGLHVAVGVPERLPRKSECPQCNVEIERGADKQGQPHDKSR